MAEKKSVFETLYNIDVSDKIEKKGRLDYLSWANAWAMLKSIYPSTTFHVHTHEGNNGLHYYTDGQTAYVEVSVVVEGSEIVEVLAVMDHNNKSIPLERLTSRDVMDSIQRCKTKCIGYHGLGLRLWTREEMPQETTATTAKKPKGEELPSIIVGDDKWKKKVVPWLEKNKGKSSAGILKQLKENYSIQEETEKEIKKLLKK